MPKKTYPGRLNELLGPPPAILGTENYEEAMLSYREEVAARLQLLMEYYHINPTAVAKWEQLAYHLAWDHVPGLRPWKPDVGTDRNVCVMLRMLFMTRVRGFAQKSAADALNDVFPELGNAEAIRSIFREQTKHPKLKQLVKYFSDVEKGIGKEIYQQALAGTSGCFSARSHASGYWQY